jgi:hypothetical protein
MMLQLGNLWQNTVQYIDDLTGCTPDSVPLQWSPPMAEEPPKSVQGPCALSCPYECQCEPAAWQREDPQHDQQRGQATRSFRSHEIRRD